MTSFSGFSGKLPDWEKFEIESCHYLNRVFSHLPVSFKREGGKNSGSSDINVYNDRKFLFSVEAKYSPCQSGQFVLVEDNGIYSLSNDSKFENNKYTQVIINFLNENKDIYSPKGQKSISIDFDQDVFAQWIIEHYKSKNSDFVITSTLLNGFKAIIPIDDIRKYFDVSAVIRRKRSGTNNVPQYRIESCINELKEYLDTLGLEISEITRSKKTLVQFNKDVNLKISERYFGDNFYLSPNRNGKGYFLKTRAKANNLNVIFSLIYKGPNENIGVDLLESYIQYVLFYNR